MRSSRIPASWSLAVAVGLILSISAIARGDWNVGDPYKMHYPQLPNPQGWDVNMTFPKVLADDFLCTETGPINDIHFWFSIEHDSTQTLALLDSGAYTLHTSIHSDIPAGPTAPYSRPGALLWQRDFTLGVATSNAHFRPWGSGLQGWYDPNPPPVVRPGDHSLIFQMNVTNIPDAFRQTAGTIYWLDLTFIPATSLPPDIPKIGWKTSISPHFNDDAVWGDFLPTTGWNELRDPLTQQSLDLAFVITPEPGSAALLVFSAIGILARRKSKAAA